MFADKKITGILDFGDTTVGTIAQELRQLYRINERSVQLAVEEYEALVGIEIDVDEVKTWAIIQELASYCKNISNGEMDHPSLLRARSNLANWLPSFSKQLLSL